MHLADYIPVQERLRAALYAACSQAKIECCCLPADQIPALWVPYLNAAHEEILPYGRTTARPW
jgi:hypothetical protein